MISRRYGVTRREAIAAIAGATATLIGCGRSRGDRQLVRFWTIGREGEVATTLIQDFVAAHPEIEVEVQKMPLTAAHEKLLTAYAGDTLPDLCQLGNTWIPEFAALHALEPLGARVTASKVIDPTDYFTEIFNSNRVDDQLFGVPWYVDTRLLFYRRDLLQKAGFDHPPTSWAEWEQMLGAIKEREGKDKYSVLLPLNEFEPLLVLALQQPSELLRDTGRFGNFRSDDFKRVMSFYRNIFERGWAPRATNTQISNVWDEFGKGYFSFYISGPWNIAEFKLRMPENLKDAWMTAPMPGPNGPGASSAGGSSLVVFSSSKAKEAAWQLAEHLSTSASQSRFYDLTGNMPPRRSSWEVPALVQSPYARAFREQLDRVRSPPKVPEWERIATQMRLAGERVVQGKESIEDAVADLDRETDEILEKRRWMMDRDRTDRSRTGAS